MPGTGAGTQWTPIVDGVEIPDQPRFLYEQGGFGHVPVLLGANRDEGWTFVNRAFPSDITVEQYEGAVETEFGADTGRFSRTIQPLISHRQRMHSCDSRATWNMCARRAEPRA